MKLNVPNDLLSKWRDIFDPVSLVQSPKNFKKIFIDAVLLVGNDENTNFLFCRKSFYLIEMRCNQS